jgi:hypothetical protein
MSMLLSTGITTAVAAVVTTPLQLRDGPSESMAFQATLTYGSGGTTATAWVQTSFDDGVTWCDVANFAFTTASARSVQNVSALTTVLAAAAATDGTLASNTANSGLLGALWRVKYTTTGTYAGGTLLRVDAQPNRGRLVSR